MKTTRKFKESWLCTAVIAAIVVGELAAWAVAEYFGLRANPLVVAFLAVGLVAALTSVLYAGEDIG